MRYKVLLCFREKAARGADHDGNRACLRQRRVLNHRYPFLETAVLAVRHQRTPEADEPGDSSTPQAASTPPGMLAASSTRFLSQQGYVVQTDDNIVF